MQSLIELHKEAERRVLFNELTEMEKQFSLCIREDEPARWFRLQEELGDMYRRVMEYYR